MELIDAVVVVTGASAGIGRATALAFAARGANVVVSARRMDLLDRLVEQITNAGGSVVLTFRKPVRTDKKGQPGKKAQLRAKSAEKRAAR